MTSRYARRRKARFVPDERPDWRDPDMKCFETVLFSDGTWRECYIPPDMKQKFAKDRLVQYQTSPWTSDPTYDLRKRTPPTEIEPDA
jgi:hypothetical protein